MKPLRFYPVAFSLLIAFLCMDSPSLHAGASNKNGNPFGNGSFFSDNGTFSAVIRGQNAFLGVCQFSTSGTNLNATNAGFASIYALGNQYLGTAIASINSSAKTLNVTYFGNSPSSVTVLPALDATVIPGLQTIITYVSSATNFVASNNCVGQFSATLQNSYPVQTFAGTGQATVRATTMTSTYVPAQGNVQPAYYKYDPITREEIVTTTVSGSRLTQ